jgi:hypothetical protein
MAISCIMLIFVPSTGRGTSTICFVGSEHGRRENWKVGDLVNKMD